ncbi:MAG: hypothetical protein RL329_4078 [Bacteroidota bacterium]|jgi:hypothetical protein
MQRKTQPLDLSWAKLSKTFDLTYFLEKNHC